jgi:hypothetical protein
MLINMEQKTLRSSNIFEAEEFELLDNLCIA